jgi:hypothetical protein
MAHRYLPLPDFHRLDWQPYGLRAENAKEKTYFCNLSAFSALQSSKLFASCGEILQDIDGD